MKVNEMNLFKDDAASNGRSYDWDGTSGSWYYIEKSMGIIEVLYADEQGRYYWGERELSRVIPVVWNNRSSAKRVARNQGGRVKVFPFRLT